MSRDDKTFVLADILSLPEVEFVKDITKEGIDLLCPAAGTFLGIVSDFCRQSVAIRFKLLRSGLRSGLNEEKRLNELSSFVRGNAKAALYVESIFKKTLTAENPRVCVVYGLILGKHVDKKSEFTHDEMIACMALERATDYDLNLFLKIMGECLSSTNHNEKQRVVFPQSFEVTPEYFSVCEWCVYNRLFIKNVTEWGKISDEAERETYYYVDTPAIIVLQYIKDAKPIWNYEQKKDEMLV